MFFICCWLTKNLCVMSPSRRERGLNPLNGVLLPLRAAGNRLRRLISPTQWTCHWLPMGECGARFPCYRRIGFANSPQRRPRVASSYIPDPMDVPLATNGRMWRTVPVLQENWQSQFSAKTTAGCVVLYPRHEWRSHSWATGDCLFKGAGLISSLKSFSDVLYPRLKCRRHFRATGDCLFKDFMSKLATSIIFFVLIP